MTTNFMSSFLKWLEKVNYVVFQPDSTAEHIIQSCMHMPHLKPRELSSVQLVAVACRSYCSIEYPHLEKGCVVILQAVFASILKFGMIQLSVYSAQLVYERLQAALEHLAEQARTPSFMTNCSV